jgi:hypothetical protein
VDLPAWSRRSGGVTAQSGVATVATAGDLTPPAAGNPVALVLADMSLRGWNGSAWVQLAAGGGSSSGGGAGAVSPIVVATDMAALAQAVPAPVNGQRAVIRVGSLQDVFDLPLVYLAARSKWVQPGSGFTAVRSTEQNAFKPLGGPNNVEVKQYIPMSNSPTGWGYTAMRNTGLLLAAGLGLEYRQHAFAHPAAGIGFYVGCCFYTVDPGDTLNTAFTNPPTGHWAETDYLYSGSSTTGFYNLIESGWKALTGPIDGGNSNNVAAGASHNALITNPKKSLYPAIYGRTDTGGQAAGVSIGFLNYALFLRLAG